MKRLFKVVPLLLLMVINADAAVNDWWLKCKTAQPDCEFATFKDIAPIYRPSREEALLGAYIKSVFERAKKEIWQNDSDFSFFQDELGSILIKVPAVGDSRYKAATPIAIQAHMDMVLAKKGAKPGEDLRPYFKGHLEFEEVDGWYQSKGNERSIGADNSTGVAIALRFLVDKSRPHPPLEIVFTVQEEVGLAGAANFKFPLGASKFISLDNMDSTLVTIGCQGASMDRVDGQIEKMAANASANFFRVSISDLKGGHSGAMIHLPRANAIKVLASVLRDIAQSQADLNIGEFRSGDIKVLNVIPNSSQAIFSTISNIEIDEIKVKLRAAIAKFSDEDAATYQILVEKIPNPDLFVISAVDSMALLDRALAAPHGVISKGDEFPNQVKTSTNFSTLNLLANRDAIADLTFGFMGRSFDLIDLSQVTGQSAKNLMEWPGFQKGGYKNLAFIDPWMAPKDSPLLTRALRDPQFKGTFIVPAYVEATVFAKKYPQMEIIGIGPDVTGFHTFNERVRIQSLSEISDALARLMAL